VKQIGQLSAEVGISVHRKHQKKNPSNTIANEVLSVNTSQVCFAILECPSEHIQQPCCPEGDLVALRAHVDHETKC
jgi:hypothetical protein